jgi:hypothetical protein
VTNPVATQCQFCGSPLAQLVAPYGAAPIAPQGGYAPLPPQQQVQGYAPQQGYGAPPPQMPSYGQPQQPYGYGGQQPGYPPNPYAAYGQGPQVQGWSGGGMRIAPVQQGMFGGSGWNTTWNIIWIIRISIAVLVIGGMMFAGCVNALSH